MQALQFNFFAGLPKLWASAVLFQCQAVAYSQAKVCVVARHLRWCYKIPDLSNTLLLLD